MRMEEPPPLQATTQAPARLRGERLSRTILPQINHAPALFANLSRRALECPAPVNRQTRELFPRETPRDAESAKPVLIDDCQLNALRQSQRPKVELCPLPESDFRISRKRHISHRVDRAVRQGHRAAGDFEILRRRHDAGRAQTKFALDEFGRG